MIIGDEVLSGSITDSNTPWLAKVGLLCTHPVAVRGGCGAGGAGGCGSAAPLPATLPSSTPPHPCLPLTQLLHSRGVDLVRVEYIPDQKRDIVDTVLRLRERVGPSGVVFTSGGIGPTHDDITYESLAAAFGATLALHQPTVDRMVGAAGCRWVLLGAGVGPGGEARPGRRRSPGLAG